MRTAGKARTLRVVTDEIAEEPPQVALVQHRLLEKAIARTAGHELIELRIQIEKTPRRELARSGRQHLDVGIANAARPRTVETETGLEQTRRFDQPTETVAFGVHLRRVERRQEAPAVTTAAFDDAVLR